MSEVLYLVSMQNIPQQYNDYRWSDTNAIATAMLLAKKHSSEHGTQTLGKTFCIFFRISSFLFPES